MLKHLKNKKGFTLLEVVIYVGLLTIITSIVTNSFLSDIHVWGYARSTRDATSAGRLMLERMDQEIKLSRSVDTITSILGTHPGKLVLDTFAGVTSTQESTLEIFLDGEELKIKRGVGTTISLSGGKARVTNLVFRRLVSSKSEIVRIELTVEVSSGKFTKEISFTTAAVLRGAY